MALSIMLRRPACLGSVYKQSLARLSTQPSIMQKAVSSNMPAASLLLQNTAALLNSGKGSPIQSAVRSLTTSSVRRSFAVDEHPHDHARLWVIERAVSTSMVPLIPIALMFPNKILDCVIAILVTAHSYWGCEALVVEYLRTLVVGNFIPKVGMLVVYLLNAMLLGGFFYTIFNRGGLANNFWKLWLNMGKPPGTGIKGSKSGACKPTVTCSKKPGH